MTEADLCEAFACDARRDGWIVYPEQGGWDMLLVRHGIQVGIQAKLKANTHVLLQALPDRSRCRLTAGPGPHYRAVLVGGYKGRTDNAVLTSRSEFHALAKAIGLLVIEPPHEFVPRRFRRDGPLTDYIGWIDRRLALRAGPYYSSRIDWRRYRWATTRPVELPPFIPDLPAGVPSPTTISAWKLAVFALEEIHEQNGFLCVADAKRVIEHVGKKWNPSGLLRAVGSSTGERIGRGLKWRIKERLRPSSMWPNLWRQYQSRK